MTDPDRDLNRLTSDAAVLDARLGEILLAELRSPVPDTVLWWCSFAGTDRHLGVAVVAAPGVVHAVRRTHELGINPGGEVGVVPIPARGIPEAYRDRLLTRAEARELDRLAASRLAEDGA